MSQDIKKKMKTGSKLSIWMAELYWCASHEQPYVTSAAIASSQINVFF